MISSLDKLGTSGIYSSIAERLSHVRERIEAAAAAAKRRSSEIELIAVGKGHPLESLLEALKAGACDFGENYANELAAKAAAASALEMTLRPRWHFQGTIQRRKIREILKYSTSILSVARVEELEEIEKRAIAPITCYLEVNIGCETTKNGVMPDEVPRFLESASGYARALIAGLMCIPPDDENTRKWFAALRTLGERHGLSRFSMGMSSDFEDAILEGSTMVRIGTAIFGSRRRNAEC